MLPPQLTTAESRATSGLSERGLTLIEIVIVVALLGTTIALVAPRLRSTQNKGQSAIRKISVLTRYLHNQARMKQQNYRLAFKIDQTEEGDGKTTYWIESGPLTAIPLSNEKMRELENLSDEEKERYVARQTFTKDTGLMKTLREKAETELPPPLKILGIDTPAGSIPLINGMAYVYFFGRGLSQEAAIHIGDGQKMHWTIMVDPLTGRSRVYDRNVKYEEFK